jgi:hypothetical protein
LIGHRLRRPVVLDGLGQLLGQSLRRRGWTLTMENETQTLLGSIIAKDPEK